MKKYEDVKMSHDHNCDCCHSNTGYEQSLDEMEFEKSACGCAVYGDLERLKELVRKRGANCLADRDKNGYTCLHYAARHGRVEMCKYLMGWKHLIDLNAKTSSCQSTALHRASYVANADIVRLLLENGARANEQGCDGKTPLHKCVEQLLAKSANDTNVRETIRLLVKHDRNLISIKDKTGKSPVDICPNILDFVDS